jgi:hypothetical protein
MAALRRRIGCSTDDLFDETRATLAALADIECRYEAKCERLERSPGAESLKRDLRAEWEACRTRERAPLERRLVDLEEKVRRSVLSGL